MNAAVLAGEFSHTQGFANSVLRFYCQAGLTSNDITTVLNGLLDNQELTA
jgi:hypothetical protein